MLGRALGLYRHRKTNFLAWLEMTKTEDQHIVGT
jgi:hypothetical protein